MTNRDKIIARHTLEIRFRNRFFGFSDLKGEMTDFFIKNAGIETVRYARDKSDRVDFLSSDLSEAMFFSMENFGIQIEATEDFEKFREKVKWFFSIISSYGKYNFGDEITRIGTKTAGLFHKNGLSLEGLKEKYKSSLFKQHSTFEKISKSKTTELWFILTNFEKENAGINVGIGPLTMLEAINKFFGNNPNYQEQDIEQGLLLEIDYFQNKEKSKSKEELTTTILKNIDDLEKTFYDFANIITS